MTESDWLTTDDPLWMLAFAGSRMSARKHRLFAVACCRQFSHLLSAQSLQALDTAEQLADSLASESQRREARGKALTAPRHTEGRKSYFARQKMAVVHSLSAHAGEAALFACRYAIAEGTGITRWTPDEQPRPDLVAAYLRDITGSPYLTVTLDSSWRTANTLDLSRTIYDERAFDRLPILADALMDAGCDNPELLGHLRSPGPHVRGCWALDLILGRS